MLYTLVALLFVITLQAGPGQSRMSNEQDQFFDAMKQGDCTQIANFLDEHNNNIPKGALHKAIKNGQKEVVTLLIGRGADVDQRYDDQCPVHVAVSNPELLAILLEHGSSVNTITKPAGETALHSACEDSHEASCALLIKHGASLIVRNQRNDTPLHRAVIGRHVTIVKQLTAVPHCIIDMPRTNGTTPLMLSAIFPSVEVADNLIASGANINAQDSKGYTALHYAVRHYDSLPTVVALLLEKKANAHIVNKKKDAPLHIAVKRGANEPAKLLIPHSNINGINAKGQTPLVKAIGKGQYETASLLLDAGANPNLGTPAPLWKAVKNGCDRGGSELMQKLIAKGADLTFIDNNGKTLTEIACCDNTRALLQSNMTEQ